jgi:pimeloyl-ACP methyl ester carboxylesterase
MTTLRKAYVNTSGGQLHFRYVRGPGAPLILLHRTPIGSVSFEPLMSALAGWRGLYALDTPGFGGSFDPSANPNVVDYATWMREALDGLALGRYHLFGHHTGTHIAVELALQAPEHCLSLALNGVLFIDATERAAFRAAIAPAALPDAEGHYLTSTWKTLRQYFTRFDPVLVNAEFAAALRSRVGRDQAFAAILQQDFPARLAQVRCPILAMAASDDPLQSYLARVPQQIPSVSTVTHGPAGIAAPELATQELAALLRGFIERSEAQPGRQP